MFNYLKGTITAITGSYITLENNNIGFMIKTPLPFSFEIDSTVTIYTYLHIREDVMDIYGFTSATERDFFLQLISVKGLGPKSALAILASGNIDQTIEAINNSNTKLLQKFPGIGAKSAQQIILDLHGKINFQKIQKASDNPKIEGIKEALKSMGYKNEEIKSVIPILDNNIDKPMSELIKIALKHFIK